VVKTGSGNAIGVSVNSTGTVSVQQNNFNISNTNTDTSAKHLVVQAGTVNASGNYFTGHPSSNPNNSGSGISVTGTAGSSLSATGNGCIVGPNCAQ
jgi:hypothetical protein